MELVFKESSQVLSDKPAYEVEFEASSDFNIHIERPSDGYFLLFQKSTPNGKYTEVNNVYDLESKTTIDMDFVGVVYPKWIKIVSNVEPTYAAIISDGEVTEIKAQSKVVEITSNGTTNITPDEGFAYLNSVKVKTNVPTSGEGGGAGSESTIEYIDVTGLGKDMRHSLIDFSSLVKWKDSYSGDVYIYPTHYASYEADNFYNEVMAVAIDFSAMVSIGNGVFGTIKEFIMDDNGYPSEMLDSIPRITKEEFYNLDVPSTPE